VNTPDLAPKDGDFVAYIEELERRRLRTGAAAPASAPGPMNPTTASKTPTPTVFPSPSTAGSVASTAKTDVVNAIPVGLFAIGLVLLVIGLAFNNSVVLVFLGVVALWQAVRILLRNLRAASATTRTQANQQVADLFASQAQRKKQPLK